VLHAEDVAAFGAARLITIPTSKACFTPEHRANHDDGVGDCRAFPRRSGKKIAPFNERLARSKVAQFFRKTIRGFEHRAGWERLLCKSASLPTNTCRSAYAYDFDGL
jgi:hypothetical protein